MKFPAVESMFPPQSSIGAMRFWVRHWFWFCVFYPLAWLRQVGVLAARAYVSLATRGRHVELLGGRLSLYYLSYTRSLLTDIIFGERFVVIRYRGALLDPGPAHARHELTAYAQALPPQSLDAVLCTHWHEEHIGNVAALGYLLQIPVYGTDLTLAEIRKPSPLPWYRELFIGNPGCTTADEAVELKPLYRSVTVGETRLRVVDSPGHCSGHVSFYDPKARILFAGDSFMGEFFTAPNADVDSHTWIETLERYTELDIDILVDGHGKVYTLNSEVPDVVGVVVRADPNELIRTKLEFTRWAADVVREGERRGLDYRTIETCLFRWDQGWSWKNWCTDQSFRLLSEGEFSRTRFISSLAASAARVPARHPRLAKVKTHVQRILWRSNEEALQHS